MNVKMHFRPEFHTLRLSCMMCCLCGIHYSFTHTALVLLLENAAQLHSLLYLVLSVKPTIFLSLPNAYCASNFSVYHNFEYVKSIGLIT